MGTLEFAAAGEEEATLVTVPGYHSARYAGTARVRQGTRGVVNPLSVPSAFGTDGLLLQNWSGYYLSSAYRDAIPLVLMILVILWRPQGLFGIAEERTV